MTIKKLYLILFSICLISLGPVYGNSTSIQTTSIQLNLFNSQIELQSPIIKKNNKYLFPLRDIIKQLKGTLNYSKKNDIYKLSFKNINCIIVPYSKDFWINNEHQFLSEKPILFQNRLYVPLDEFFTIAGYSISKKKTKITINQKKQTTQTAYYNKKETPSKKKQEIQKPSSFESKIELTQLNLPKKNQYTSISLIMTNDNSLTTSKWFEKDDILYAPITKLLKKEGLKITKKRNTVTIKHLDKEFNLSTKSTNVRIKTKDQTINKFIESPIIIKENDIFYPITSIASLLDLKLTNSNNKLIFQKKLNKIDIKNNKTSFSIELMSNFKLTTQKLEKLKNNKEIKITLGYTTAETIKKKYKKTWPYKISIEKNNFDTIITIKHTNRIASPIASRHNKNLKLTFYPIIKRLNQYNYTNSARIEILTSGKTNYTLTPNKKSNKLILDINNSVTLLPNIIKSKTNKLIQIRTSQKEKNPPKTRIVFDLHSKHSLLSHKQKSNKIIINFGNKNLSFLSKVKNKVIVIDPGHGGRDPGSIGKNSNYEKKYTMDIAIRLKKLLKEKGAKVILCRNGDSNPSLNKRTQIANRNKADIFLSLHINSFKKSYANGTETYYYKYQDKKLAYYIHKELITDLKRKDNGLKKAKLFVLRHSKMAACLIEPLFITNKHEFNLLNKSYYRQKIANSISKGVFNYLDKQN